MDVDLKMALSQRLMYGCLRQTNAHVQSFQKVYLYLVMRQRFECVLVNFLGYKMATSMETNCLALVATTPWQWKVTACVYLCVCGYINAL